MKIKIACVGKVKDAFYRDAVAEYAKRLSRFCTLEIAEVADEKAPETLSPAEETQVMEREGERLSGEDDRHQMPAVIHRVFRNIAQPFGGEQRGGDLATAEPGVDQGRQRGDDGRGGQPEIHGGLSDYNTIRYGIIV